MLQVQPVFYFYDILVDMFRPLKTPICISSY